MIFRWLLILPGEFLIMPLASFRSFGLSVVLMLVAIFCSGVAAIINQIVWQRALKVYLAGSEAISSMIVVLVFMLGLGLGSYHIGRIAARIRNPLRMLGFVEFGLFAINLLICAALTLSISVSANAMQQAAFAMGIPLRVMYAAVSGVILIAPCYLMGITMPLVSEGAHRQLGVRNTGFLTTLFFLNTLGAVGGSFLTGFALLPYLGQRRSLVVAFGLNLLAGLLIFAIKATRRSGTAAAMDSVAAAAPSAVPTPAPVRGFRRADYFGFFLGFWALAYEMYLLRIGALAFEPVPTTFSMVLGCYLLFWSAGLFIARHVQVSFGAALVLSGVLILLVPHYFYYTGRGSGPLLLVMMLPCVAFGLAFGRIVMESTVHWGNDVGRFYFMNTVGSCLGILLTVLVGYRFHPVALAWVVGAAYLVMALAGGGVSVRRRWLVAGGVGAALWVWAAVPVVSAARENFVKGGPQRAFFGPDGVVQVHNGKAMIWDGLWHSDLSDGGDHVGTNNWLMGAVPYMAHKSAAAAGNAGGAGTAGDAGLDCLVVGLGTGITAVTLAQYPDVARVHVYEINRGLERLLNEFPAGTLDVAENEKVEIDWQDGRVGLVLNPRQYDIITQQPTYLKQAGSSMLLSREYMEMVRGRLKPGGVFCVYCNSMGNKAQAAVVRRAAAEVFPYQESGGGGYLLLLSNDPIQWDEATLTAKLEALEPGSAARLEAEAYSVEDFVKYLDQPRLDWQRSPYMVTDDHPLVEYPAVAERLAAR